MLCIVILCGSLYAQTDKTITVRMIDSRTGKLIATSDFQVRVNHDQTIHGNWVVKNDDGTGKLTVPADTTVLSVQATYDSATMVYVNCDTNKDLGSSDHAAGTDHWYPVAAILASGVVAPNGCAGKKIPEKLQVIAKPGEFVFFVRKRNAREEFQD
jgi:adhesin HecA-like repeat protein